MTPGLRFTVDESAREEILQHLLKCDGQFHPRLSTRVDLAQYARKIRERAVTLEAWSGPSLVGLVAGYLDRTTGIAFVTNVSVYREFSGHKVATRLLEAFVARAREASIPTLKLEVAKANAAGQALFAGFGFAAVEDRGDFLLMQAPVVDNAARRAHERP